MKIHKGLLKFASNPYNIENYIIGEWFSEKDKWEGIKSIGMVCRTVTYIKRDTESIELSYYISSIEAPVESESDLFAKAIRNHWGYSK